MTAEIKRWWGGSLCCGNYHCFHFSTQFTMQLLATLWTQLVVLAGISMEPIVANGMLGVGTAVWADVRATVSSQVVLEGQLNNM